MRSSNDVPLRSNAAPLSRTAGPLPKSDSIQQLVSLMNCPTTSPSAKTNPEPPASPQAADAPSTSSSSLIAVQGLDNALNTHHIPCDPQQDQLSLSGLGLHTVVLDALAETPDNAIREVSLAANILQTVNLHPLAACSNLTVLTLNSNRLTSINLASLANCRNLERLWLHDNSISAIDLAPLAACKALRSIYLEDNSIHNSTIDLSPLESTPNLRSLRVGGNRLSGALDLTPLLQCPALSVFNVDTSVSLTADADSTQARVSPALRRIVLDIKFTGNAQATVTRRSKGRTTPPVSPRSYTSSPPSPRRRTATAETTTTPVVPATQSLPATAAAKEEIPSSPVSSSSSLPLSCGVPQVMKILLVGFRRLARYATEDILLKCGQALIRATDQGALSHDQELVMDSHVMLLYSPSSNALRKVCSFPDPIPTVVVGTERYRSSIDNEMLGLLDRFNFYTDPLSADDAKLVFTMGKDFMCGTDIEPSTRVKRVSALSPSSVQMSSLANERDLSDGHEPLTATAHQSSLTTDVSLESVRIELEHIEDDDDTIDSGNLSARSNDQITIGGDRCGGMKSWSDVSRILSGRKSRRPGASWSGEMDSDVGGFCRTKLRAERAAIEAAFLDLGGYATMDSCAAIARACGLPKCAGPSLFRGAFGSSFEIESTTPEAGVPNPPMERKKRISNDSFLIYWDSRIKLYEGEERLSNILEDSHYTRVQTTGENSGYSAYGAPNTPCAKELDCEETGRNCRSPGNYRWQSKSHRGRPNGRSQFGVNGASMTMAKDLTCPCDAGIEDLIRTFMEGRSSRFGSYALVKMSEAVAIGSALVLYAIRGLNKNRVGGRARPVCPKEVRESKLNAALIAAEVGIFEGVTSGLSMNEIRSVKGSFATEVSPGVIPRSGGCALNCSLSLEEIQRFCLTRKTLLPGAVRLALRLHCRSGMSMTLSEFAVMVCAMNDASTDGAVDYFFSIGDVDQNDLWTIADMQEFHKEKERMWEDDGMAVSDLRDFWVNLGDMVGIDIWRDGISRRQLQKLGEKDRKTVIQSLLFVDDDYSLLNIRRTMELNRNSSTSTSLL